MGFLPITSPNMRILCEESVKFVSEYRMQAIVRLSMLQGGLIHILVLQIGGAAESQSHWVVILNSAASKHTDLRRPLEIHREYTHVSCMTVPAESLS